MSAAGKLDDGGFSVVSEPAQAALDDGGFKVVSEPPPLASAATPAQPVATTQAQSPLPRPQEPVSSWLQTGIDTIKQIPAAVEKSAGGILSAMGNSGLADISPPPSSGIMPNDPQAAGLENLNTELRASPMSPANIGRHVAESAQKSLMANAPNVPEGSAKNYANIVGLGIAQMLPALGATILTHSATPIIAQTAATSFGSNYADEIAKDPSSPDAAAAKAAAYATADTAATVIGIKAFGIQPFTSAIGKVTETATGRFATIFQQTTGDMIKNLMAQGLAIQPAISVANKGIDNWIGGKPITEGMESAYVTGAIQNTLVLGITHLASSRPPPTYGKVQTPPPDMGSGGNVIEGEIVPPGSGPAPSGTLRLAAPIDARDIAPGDEDSPIPTDAIAKGRQAARAAGTPISEEASVATAEQTPQNGSDILAANGLPTAGSRVNLNLENVPPLTGTIHSGFNAEVPDSGGMTADGLHVTLDTGEMFSDFMHNIKAAGITITPELAQEAGLPPTVATEATATPQPAAAPQPVSSDMAVIDQTAPKGMPADLFHQPAAAVPPPTPIEITPLPVPAEVQTQPVTATPAPAATTIAPAPTPIQSEPVVAPTPTPTTPVIAPPAPPATPMQALAAKVADARAQQVGAIAQPKVVPAAKVPLSQMSIADKLAQRKPLKETERQALYNAYFAPGRTIEGYGGKDVVSTAPTFQPNGNWQVGVREIAKDGVTLGRERFHSTAPKREALLAVARSPEFQAANPVTVTKTTRAALPPSTETSVLENIRRLGGIKTQDANGKDTKEGQDIRAVLKDVKQPGLINNKSGMRPDQIRENMKEHGWFGRNPDRGTDMQDLYDLMDKEVRSGPQYHPESEKGVAVAEKAQAESSARLRADAHAELDNFIKESKELFSPAEKAAMHEQVDGGFDPLSAVVENIERRAMRDQYEDHAATNDQEYHDAFEPDRLGEGAVDRGAGQGIERSAPVATDEGAAGKAGGTTAAPVGTPSVPATEPGAQGLDQTILPGAEHSARQLAQAREAKGHGRATTAVEQKIAGGMFAKPEDDQRPLFQRRAEAPPFFSALTRGVEGIKMDKAPPGQWEATIKNMPGVKSEEIAWSGLNEWLHSHAKPVTKDAVLQHLRENEVRVQEVQHGTPTEPPAIAAARERFQQLSDKSEKTPLSDAEATEMNKALKVLDDQPNPWLSSDTKGKYGSYTLPGGENYRELLLTLPDRGAQRPKFEPLKALPEGHEVIRDQSQPATRQYGIIPPGQAHGRPMYDMRFANAEEAQQGVLAMMNQEGALKHKDETRNPNDFRSSHFDEPNILAHIRFDDRTGPNGEKILHMAEVQSDWHQKGRRYGYTADMLPEDLKAKVIHRDDGWSIENKNWAPIWVGKDEGAEGRARERAAAIDRDTLNHNNQLSAPNAPFKTSWHELALKRMLRYASENGYDRLSWDTGDTNADRYDLSKQISHIDHKDNGDGTYGVEAIDKKGGVAWDADKADPKTLEDHLGKDIAEKIASGEGDVRANHNPGWKRLSGLDLKVGGSGMRTFYDSILPAAANKLGKKFGAKVEPSQINSEKSGFVETIYEGPRLTPAWIEQQIEHHAFRDLPVSIQSQIREALQQAEHGATNEEISRVISPRAAEFMGGRLVERPTAPVGNAVHSIPITPAMRESVMQGQPMFKAGEADVAAPKDGQREQIYPGVDLVTSPKFSAERASLASDMRDWLDKRNLHAVGVRVADAIENMGDGTLRNEDGVYLAKIINLALDAKDPSSVITHEVIHALRRMGFITKDEWAILEREAKATWLNRYADKLKGYDDADKIEESIAFAHQEWAGGRPTRFAILNRIFSRIRDAFNKIRSAFSGRGLHTPKDVFGADASKIFENIERGKVGERGPGFDRREAPAFQHGDEPPDEHQTAIDNAWDTLIASTAKKLGWEGEPTSRAMYLKVFKTPKGPAQAELIRSANIIKGMEDQRANPLRFGTAPNIGTGETKVRGAAQGAADMAAKSGHTIEDLPTYDASKQAPLMEKARKFVANDANYEQAQAVAMGSEPAPYGQNAVSIRIAVEERATKDGDFGLLSRVATQSKLNVEATTSGQNNAMYAQRDPHSAAAAIQEVSNARKAAAEETAPKAKKDAIKEMLREANKQPDTSVGAKKLKLQAFINAVVCKD